MDYESVSRILLCGDRIVVSESKPKGSPKLRRLSSVDSQSSSGSSAPSVASLLYTGFFNSPKQTKPDEEVETFDEEYLITEINKQRKKEEKTEMLKYEDITRNINNGYLNTMKKFNSIITFFLLCSCEYSRYHNDFLVKEMVNPS